jgi:hypothetical protein
MLTNGGNTGGLFRGAFMQSGAPIPIGDISDGQVTAFHFGMLKLWLNLALEIL